VQQDGGARAERVGAQQGLQAADIVAAGVVGTALQEGRTMTMATRQARMRRRMDCVLMRDAMMEV
jgi:hypothetical protein